MFAHFFRGNQRLCLPGPPALFQLVHQADGGQRLFVVPHVHDGVFAPAVLGEENGGALGDVL